MNYLLHLLIYIEIFGILSLSLNLIVGLNGMLSLAHASFYGVGAYITALLTLKGVDFFSALLLSALTAALLSLLISAASLRFKNDIFILVTLAFQVVFFATVYNWIGVTKGPYGIPGIPRPPVVGASLLGYALLFGALFACIFFVMWKIHRSSFALSVMAVRDDVLAAESLGKRVFILRARSIALGSSVAAIAGGMYASYVTFIDPSSFSVDESILLVSMVLIGGSGNLKGPIVGAVVLVLLPEFLRGGLNLPDSIAPNVRMIIYGLSLVVLMFFRPRGIAGLYRYE